ncbi:MAG TPA: hypothetical protein VKV26_04720 [Dehalococcoidia bacterium]|nr:hypothetical protein [Dehalococcoidia bacterium]
MLFPARRRPVIALIALAALAQLLAAGGRAFAQTPAAGPSATPAAAGSAEITRASDGQTVHVPLDGGVTVRLGEELDWTLSFDPQGILQPRPGVGTLARGVQAVLRAAQPGTTTLTAEGRPHCNPGQACAQFIVSVLVTIVVDPAPSGTTQQPAPAASTPNAAAPPTTAPVGAPPAAASATPAPGVVLPNTGTGGSAGANAATPFVVLAATALALLAAGWRLYTRPRRR